MVVKTDTCAWSETKIYPGHGRRFVTKGGQLVFIQNSKVRALYHQRKKSAKLGWTMAWRRMHKKLNVESQSKRKARRVVKSVRAPVGFTLDKMVSMRKTVVAKKAVDAAAGPVRQAAVKDAKDKAKAKSVAAKATRAAQPKAAPAAKTHGGKGR